MRKTADRLNTKQPVTGDSGPAEVGEAGKPGVERTLMIVVMIFVLGGALTLGIAVALLG